MLLEVGSDHTPGIFGIDQSVSLVVVVFFIFELGRDIVGLFSILLCHF